LSESKFAAAKREYLKALAPWPTYPDANIGLAIFMEKENRVEEAIALLQEALRYDRKKVGAYIQKGNILNKKGEKERALACYRAAGNLIEDNSWTHNILGIAFAEAGYLNQALSQFYHALILAPKRADTNNNIGRVLTLQERPKDALPYLLAAIALQSDFPEAYNNAGIAMQKLGNLEKAAYYFSVALILKPDYEKARSHLRHLAGLIANSTIPKRKK
jgi:tetratricopeptide (TPR) repeat protein